MYSVINKTWLDVVKTLVNQGGESSPRGMKIKEVLHCQTCADMHNPVLSIKSRKLGYKFMPAEAAWILSGDDRVKTIEPYSKSIARFSDDGKKFFGAYGTKIKEQINYVVDKIAKDLDTRQAVINIWRESPHETNDVPCTISAQWIVRDNKICCIDTMRSSDIWLGWPYDIFNFSMISTFIALKLREEYGIKLDLGWIALNAGSQHLYENNWAAARVCLSDNEQFEVEPLDLDEFDGPYDLLNHLWNVANRKPITKKFLKELY
nr:MAG TPA: hypothetical protein [Caudoviricetes sp.]